MLRKMLLAVALLGAAAPAHAQLSGELTSGAWSCRMTSLTGEPGMDVNLAFDPEGSLEGWFLAEIPEGGDVIGLEFSITGNWTLEDDVISSIVTDSELISGTLNGEEFTAEDLAEMADGMDEQLASLSGESTIAYIAPHALVLDEDDASISCWR
jgi:hypothetical protein